eukprot:320313-Prymnesium_polylepis.1
MSSASRGLKINFPTEYAGHVLPPTKTQIRSQVTCRSPGWVRSVEKCRFGAQSSCAPSQRCVRPRRRK